MIGVPILNIFTNYFWLPKLFYNKETFLYFKNFIIILTISYCLKKKLRQNLYFLVFLKKVYFVTKKIGFATIILFPVVIIFLKKSYQVSGITF